MTNLTNSQLKPFLGILMTCCKVYTRIYKTHDGKAFAGHCPRCARPVRVDIVSEGGMSGRFFKAGP